MLFSEEMMSVEKIYTNDLVLKDGTYKTDWLVYRFGTVHEDIRALAVSLANVKGPHDWTYGHKVDIFEEILEDVYRRMKKNNSKWTVSKTINRWPGIEITTQWLEADVLEVKVSTKLATAA